MRNKILLIMWVLLCGFAQEKGHFTTTEIEGDWKDVSNDSDSWHILSLYNSVGDIPDSTYKLVNDTFYAYSLKDYRYPKLGGTWAPTNVVVKHTQDSLVFYAYNFKKYIHLYNFTRNLDKAPGFDKISLSGHAWYADYPTVQMELNKDGSLYFSGTDYKKVIHNFTYQLSPKAMDYFQQEFKELSVDTMSNRYECSCPFAWKDTLDFDYKGQEQFISIKGTEDTPPILQLYLTAIMSIYEKVPMVRTKEQHKFVDFSKGYK